MARLLRATPGCAERVLGAGAWSRWLDRLRVDDPATMRALLDMGVDGIITDRPDLLREVLIGRGEWPRASGVRPATPAPATASAG